MQCDYVNCPQNNKNNKCMAPGYKGCLRAKDDVYNHKTDGVVYYVFGKKKAKKAKEQFPNITVMYRNARTKGYWVEYK